MYSLDINKNKRICAFLDVKLVICIIVYTICIFVLSYGKIFFRENSTYISVVIQIELMLLIFILKSSAKYRFIISSLLILASSVSLWEIVGLKLSFMISLCTLAVMFCFYSYSKELSKRLRQLNKLNTTLSKSREIIYKMDCFDHLTGLPNRKMMKTKLEALIETIKDTDEECCVIILGLDNLKKINDTVGHNVGDEFIKHIVSGLVEKKLDNEDILGRISGDELILITRGRSETDIEGYISEIKIFFAESFTIDQHRLSASVSFGAAFYGKDSINASELIKYAGIARHCAKECVRRKIRIFNRNMLNFIVRRTDLENGLADAIDKKEMYLVYQPQYSSNEKRLRGLEVLLRWNCEKWGMISPSEFIPIAEETGQIVRIGEWILRESCKKLKYINHTLKNGDIVMSVNISTLQIMDCEFIDRVKRIIQETGVDPKSLEFEITESVLISSMEYVTQVLDEIKSMGIKIALDDFGTGYSSLSYLRALPIDTLKIDKSFIDNVNSVKPEGKIVNSLISLVHQLGINVVAEGVENQHQINYLKESSCDYIQGYLWGKPMESDALTQLMKNTEIYSRV